MESPEGSLLQPLILPSVQLAQDMEGVIQHLVIRLDYTMFDKAFTSMMDFDLAGRGTIPQEHLEMLQLIVYLCQHPALCRRFDFEQGPEGGSTEEADAWKDTSKRFEFCKARAARHLDEYQPPIDGTNGVDRVRCITECQMDTGKEKVVGINFHFLVFDPEWDWGHGFAIALELFKGHKAESLKRLAQEYAKRGRDVIVCDSGFIPEQCHRNMCDPCIYWSHCNTYLQQGFATVPWCSLQEDWVMDPACPYNPTNVFSLENMERLSARVQETRDQPDGEWAIHVNDEQAHAINYEADDDDDIFGGVGGTLTVRWPMPEHCRMFPLQMLISVHVIPLLRLPTPCHPQDSAEYDLHNPSHMSKLLRAVFRQAAGGVRPPQRDVFYKIRNSSCDPSTLRSTIDRIVDDVTIAPEDLLDKTRSRFLSLRLQSIVEIESCLTNPEQLPYYEQCMHLWLKDWVNVHNDRLRMVLDEEDYAMTGVRMTRPEEFRTIMRPEATAFGNFVQELYTGMDDLLRIATTHSTLALMFFARHAGCRSFSTDEDASGGLHIMLRGNGDVGKSFMLDMVKRCSMPETVIESVYQSESADLVEDHVGNASRDKKRGRHMGELNSKYICGYNNDSTGNTTTKELLESGKTEFQRATVIESMDPGKPNKLGKVYGKNEVDGYTMAATNDAFETTVAKCGGSLEAMLTRWVNRGVAVFDRPGKGLSERSSERVPQHERARYGWFVRELQVQQYWCNVVEIGHQCFHLEIECSVAEVVCTKLIDFLKQRGSTNGKGSRDKSRVLKLCREITKCFAVHRVFNDPESPLFEKEFTTSQLYLETFYTAVAPKLVCTHEIAYFAFGLLLDQFQTPPKELNCVILALLCNSNKARMPRDRLNWESEKGDIKFKFDDRNQQVDYNYFEFTGDGVKALAKVAADGSGAFGAQVSEANAAKYIRGMLNINNIQFYQRSGPGLRDINLAHKRTMAVMQRSTAGDGKWWFSVEAARYFASYDHHAISHYGNYATVFDDAIRSTFDCYTPEETLITGLTYVDEFCPHVLQTIVAKAVDSDEEEGDVITKARLGNGDIFYTRESPAQYHSGTHLTSLFMCDLEEGESVQTCLEASGNEHLSYEGLMGRWETYVMENPELVSAEDYVETQKAIASKLADDIKRRANQKRDHLNTAFMQANSPSRLRPPSMKRRRMAQGNG